MRHSIRLQAVVVSLAAATVLLGCPMGGSQSASNWDKQIDGNGGQDTVYSITTNDKNDVYVAGTGENLQGSSSGFDWWIKKYDQFGTERVDIVRDESSDDRVRGLATDSNGNVYAVGSGLKLVNDISARDWWIRRFDSALVDDPNWDRKIGVLEDDAALDVAVNSHDNVFVVGYGSNLITETSEEDWWIKKFYTHGAEDLRWDLRMDNRGGTDIARAIAIDSEDNVYVVGETEAGDPSSKNWWIKKFAPNGEEVRDGWNRTIDFEGRDNVAYDVAVDSQDNVYVAGYRTILDEYGNPETEAWIKKFAPNGAEQTSGWDKTFQSPGEVAYAYGIGTDSSDNVYVVARGVQVLSNAVGGDFWTKKYAPDGTEDTKNWDIADGTTYSDKPFTLAVDGNNDVYVGGYVDGPRHRLDLGDWFIEKY